MYKEHFREENWDVVIGTNVFDEELTEIKYTVCADAQAVISFRNRPNRDRLETFKFVLSGRAHYGSSKCKNRPASPDTFRDYLDANDHIEEVVDYRNIPKECSEKQKYFSSGHLAFWWAHTKYPGADIHLFGFDSVFTGTCSQTYSDRDVSATTTQPPIRTVYDEIGGQAVTWNEYWQILLNDYSEFGTVTFHGVEGDRQPEFSHKTLRVILT